MIIKREAIKIAIYEASLLCSVSRNRDSWFASSVVMITDGTSAVSTSIMLIPSLIHLFSFFNLKIFLHGLHNRLTFVPHRLSTFACQFEIARKHVTYAFYGSCCIHRVIRTIGAHIHGHAIYVLDPIHSYLLTPCFSVSQSVHWLH